jgi:hypothetical protein
MDPDVNDLFEAFLSGRIDNGEGRLIQTLQSLGLSGREIVVQLTTALRGGE